MRIIFAILFLVTISSATSLSCISQTPEQRMNASTIVFTGTVIDTDDGFFRQESLDITFIAKDVYRGDVTEKITVRQECWFECEEIEGEYLILARDDGIGWCDHPIPIAEADEYLALLGTPEDPEPYESSLLERLLDWFAFWR